MDKRAQGAVLAVIGLSLILLSAFYPQVLPFATVVIDTAPPYIVSVVPDGTQTQPGTVYPGGTISVTVKDDLSGLKNFMLCRAVLQPYYELITLISDEALNGIKEKTFTWTVPPDFPLGTYGLWAVVWDMAGNYSQRDIYIRVSQKPKYTLTVNISGKGSVSVSGYGTYTQPLTFDEGTTVTLTATPADGWRFVQWTGDPSSLNNPLTITMNRNRTLTANFEALPTSVYVSVYCDPPNGGTVSPGSGLYTVGSTVQFEAKPSTGFEFEKWVWGTVESNRNPVSVTISSSTQSIKAVFRQIQAPEGDFYINGQKVTNSIFLNTRTLTFSFVPTRSEQYIKKVYIDIQGHGSLDLVKQPDGKFSALWTAPADGTYFMDVKMDWTAQTGVRLLSLTFSVLTPVENRPPENYPTENRPARTFKLYYSCSPPDGGSIEGKVLEARAGETIRLRAVPNRGYVFDKWQGDVVSYDQELVISVYEDMSIVAVFKKEEEPLPVQGIFVALGAFLILIGLVRCFL